MLCPCPDHCGSWLACEGASTFNIVSGWSIAFAGKPAATGLMATADAVSLPGSLWELACLRRGQHLQHRQWLEHCFRRQASSHGIDGDRRCCVLARSIVGAGLPAKGPAPSTSSVAGALLSQASQLPRD